ncbi:MAG TPA: protein-disulfide reductase DsbD domain-containing protein [Fimbriimonadaceae bacterium]|nr:protein-disulfide reductase DsbD domain-containing protein [Fimbriimonadaceae bacterium]
MIRSLLSALFVFAVCLAVAQTNTAPTVKVVLPKTAKPGATVSGTIELSFADGLHGYQNPPTDEYQIPVKVSVDTKGFTLKKVTYPKGVMKSIGGDPKPCGVYEGTVKIPIVVTIPAKAGAAEVKFVVSYQQCNDASCFPPAKVTGIAKLQIKK